MSTDPVLVFNEHAYQTMGFGAQRRYPNEELCRFMGRNYFSVEHDKRHNIRFLEIGCGAGSNLWMLAREGDHMLWVRKCGELWIIARSLDLDVDTRKIETL